MLTTLVIPSENVDLYRALIDNDDYPGRTLMNSLNREYIQMKNYVDILRPICLNEVEALQRWGLPNITRFNLIDEHIATLLIGESLDKLKSSAKKCLRLLQFSTLFLSFRNWGESKRFGQIAKNLSTNPNPRTKTAQTSFLDDLKKMAQHFEELTLVVKEMESVLERGKIGRHTSIWKELCELPCSFNDHRAYVISILSSIGNDIFRFEDLYLRVPIFYKESNRDDVLIELNMGCPSPSNVESGDDDSLPDLEYK